MSTLITSEVEAIYFNVDNMDRDLGIEYLTAESCAFSMRVLCDLNEDGVALIKDFFGAEPVQPNWNSRVADKPAVRSIMLTPFAFTDLWIHGMLRKGATVLRFKPGRFHTPACALLNATEADIATYRAELGEWLAEIITKDTTTAPLVPPSQNIGISVTPEADGLRQVCALDNAGRAIVNQCFGVQAGETILLTQEMLVDAYCFAMLQSGWTVVRFNPGQKPRARGFWTPTQEEFSAYQAEHNEVINRIYRPPTHSCHVAGRNVHQFSGRVA